MKKVTGNVLAVVGGAWTALMGILLIGSFMSMGGDDAQPVTPLVWVAVLLAIGIVMFYSGLRMMRRR